MRGNNRRKKLGRLVALACCCGGLLYGNRVDMEICKAEEQIDTQIQETEEPAAVTGTSVSESTNGKNGFYETEDGKVYHLNEDNKKSRGYFKVKGNYYYANEKGYLLQNQWKYVKIGKRKYKLYFDQNGKQKQNVTALIGEQTQYKIEVNIKKNMVVIYAKDGEKGYTIPVKAMVCSCGIAGHSTITGTYSYLRTAGKWHPLYYGTYGKYCTRISGPYLFHSVVYKRNGDSYSLYPEEYKKLGKAASHGCIRLAVKDAKWIYNRAGKCSVLLYKEDGQMPLKKPQAKAPCVLQNGKAYDPTDVDVE